MSAYDFLADYYDDFQKDIDPCEWAQFIDGIVKKYGRTSGDGEAGRLLLCDLGCGTGLVTCELSKMGYDTVGVDNSLPMLERARTRAEEEGCQILWLCQDMTALDLYGTMDVFVSLLDTMNHITNKKDIVKLLKSFFCFLNPGGLFIFDVVTKKHFAETLGQGFFYSIEDDSAIFWENDYDEKAKMNTASLTMFGEQEDGRYERCDEDIVERYYSDADIRELVRSCGLEVVAVYGDRKRRKPNEKDERVFYCIRRPEETEK